MKAYKKDQHVADRLKRRSDFLRVNDLSRREGAKWVSKSVILLAVPNEQAKSRIGITVTKKLEKTAVGRNRIKRRLRAACAEAFPGYAKDGLDFVLIGRQETATSPYADLIKDLRWCIKRLGHASG